MFPPCTARLSPCKHKHRLTPERDSNRDSLDVLPLQGAPEGVLDRCAYVRVGSQKVPMTPAVKKEILKHCAWYGTGKLLPCCGTLPPSPLPLTVLK